MQPDVCFSGEADYRLAWIKGPTLILCLHKNLCGITMTLIAWMIMAKKVNIGIMKLASTIVNNGQLKR